MNITLTTMLVALSLMGACFGDMQIMPIRSLGAIAKLAGVDVTVKQSDGLVNVTIEIEAGNEFVGANGFTTARLSILDAERNVVASVKLDPFGGTRRLRVDGRAYYTMEFSLREQHLKESTLTFWELLVRHTKKHRVTLADALEPLTRSR